MDKNLELSDASLIKKGHGLFYQGKVTAINGTTGVTVASLSGFGNDFFKNWFMFVVRDAGGASAAPQNELTAVSDYVSTTGAYTITAFTSPAAVGDTVQLVHPILGKMANVLNIDGNNAFSVGLDGGTQTDLDAVFTALDTMLGDRNVARAAGVLADTESMFALVRAAVTAGPLTVFGDITTYTNTTSIASTDLIGFEDGFFIGWTCFLIYDDGDAGATPQGARSLVTAYTSASGALTLASALPAAGAQGDQIMLVHPVLLDGWNMRGGARTLESIGQDQDAIPDVAKIPTSQACTVTTEHTLTDLGITATVPFWVEGIHLGMENMAAGDVVRWRGFIDWDDASIADAFTEDELWTYKGADGGMQGGWAYRLIQRWVTYEIAFSVNQLDGTSKTVYAVLDTAKRGS